MPVLYGAFDWEVGLVWKVGFLDGAIASDRLTQEDIHERLHVCDALVDTGASRTCISRSVATGLGINPVSKQEMHTAGGLVQVNLYHVKFAFLLPTGPMAPDGSIPTGAFWVPSVLPVLEFDSGEDRYPALIGRDILHQGMLTMSSDRHFSFAF